MAELTPQEKLQPSLLDRLTDEEPDKQVESRAQRVMPLRKLRECVLRDMAWLFNTSNFDAVADLKDYPEVARSVLNYGLPELSGRTLSGVDVVELERAFKQAIIAFEPRILRNTVKVKLLVDEQEMNHNALSFEIIGELWAQPIPQQLFLKTQIDLELGDVDVIEYR